MLKLWLVVRGLNEISSSVGPLTTSDVVFGCEYSIGRPGTPEYYRAKAMPGS